METSSLFWIGFLILIGVLIWLDLVIFHHKGRTIKLKEAVIWSLFWIFISLLFNLFIYFTRGPDIGLQFFTGYLIEKALSIDNVFVIVIVFKLFRVPHHYHYKLLLYGILGALVMRFVLILAGVKLMGSFHWMFFLFGLFLCLIGMKWCLQSDRELHPRKNILFRMMAKVMPMTHKYHDGYFFIRRSKQLVGTPLFLVLLLILSSDFIFAIDSIPAIFAVTNDRFVIYTSNAFALLGLRSIHFVLMHFLEAYSLLKFSLAIILIFIGAKMLLEPIYPIPIAASLYVVLSILVISLTVLIYLEKKGKIKS